MDNNSSNQKLPNLGGSIARRVVIVCCFFLIVPLLFYSIYFYVSEYNRKLEDIFATLVRVQKVQRHLLKDWNNYELDTLKIVNYLMHTIESYTDEYPEDTLNELMQKLADFQHISFIAYIDLKMCKDVICTATSSFSIPPKELIKLLDMHKIRSGKVQYFLKKVPNLDHMLFVAKGYYFQELKDLGGIIIVGLSLQELLQRLYLLKGVYPANLSILSENGEILDSTNPELVGQQVGGYQSTIQLTPYPKYGGFEYEFNGEKKLALLQQYEPAKLQLLIDVSKKELFKGWDLYSQRMLVLLAMIIAIGGIGTLIITWRISKPLRNLCETMHAVGSGDLSKRFEEDRMGFEINQIGKRFNEMVESLVANMAEAEKQKIKQEVLHKELVLGQKVQKSLLPSSLPTIEGLHLQFGFVAASEVAGDFYDVFAKDNDTVMFCVADTSGKGVFACFYSLILRSILRTCVQSYDDLSEIIKKTNQLFCLDTENLGVFVTIWLAIYNTKTRELTYSSCGHNPPYYIKENGELERLNTQGMALGVGEFEPEIKKIILHSKEILALYTDGIVEAHSPHNELFGEVRLQEFLLRYKNLNCYDLVQKVLEEIEHHSKGTAQHDDMTIVIVKGV